MNMNKTWVNSEKGDDKIIAVGNEMIYKVNPKDDAIPQFVQDIESNHIPNSVLSIPFSYLRFIQLQEGKKYIHVSFGSDSNEHLKVNDDQRRMEIFEYLKAHIPKSHYRLEAYSKLKSAKKPLIGFIIISILFSWSLYLAIQIESGIVYEIIGDKNSIVGIVLSLANLGVLNVVLIFGSFLALNLFFIIKKIRNRPVVHEIYFNR